MAVDTLLTRVIAPAGAVGFALLAGAHGWGLFNLLHRAPRDRQQLRLQLPVVGPPLSHLPPEPEAGHDGVTLGIDQFRDRKELRLDRMLAQPFRNDRGSKPSAAASETT